MTLPKKGGAPRKGPHAATVCTAVRISPELRAEVLDVRATLIRAGKLESRATLPDTLRRLVELGLACVKIDAGNPPPCPDLAAVAFVRAETAAHVEATGTLLIKLAASLDPDRTKEG